eukprot:CAMPEP_0115485036 /NCGR_PEP_ID=MMETSP0271-20121206/59700_1 /TAXON_ID=71861 /ORGANISM="Scrippsiella trochoidea, Strain CCMP3099" /LENGTH=392 /DNA_ID=CAMNT_0002912977 /DNA_START=201 /DNA_END=1378 /DNA_ORIENTATION=-
MAFVRNCSGDHVAAGRGHVPLDAALPEDARDILVLFKGTSDFMLRKGSVQTGKRGSLGCPGLGDHDPENTRLIPAPVQVCELGKGIGGNPLTTTHYAFIAQILNFWQAICVTSLIISYLSRPIESWKEVVLYLLAWAEWPAMIMYAVPLLIRRLTVRNSIGAEVDYAVISQVSLEAKESLLRYYIRLVQLLTFTHRAAESGESWAIDQGEAGEATKAWKQVEAHAAWKRGLRRFDSLPNFHRQGIWHLFESWDINNDGTVMVDEIAKNLQVLTASGSGCCSIFKNPRLMAESLVRLVDHDGTRQLSWDKCRAAVALAISNRPPQELREDIHTFFEIIDEDGDGRITVFELWPAFCTGTLARRSPKYPAVSSMIGDVLAATPAGRPWASSWSL